MNPAQSPKPCLWCDRPRQVGMFCTWHNALEAAVVFVSVHWTTRDELADLSDLMATRSLDELADFARGRGARLVFQLADRIRQVAGPHLGPSVYSELKRRVAARRDAQPAPQRSAAAFVPPPTREPFETTASLGLEEPQYILGNA